MALAITQVYYRVLSGQGYECWGGRLKRLSVVSNPDTDTGYHLDYTSGPDFETSWAWTVITSLHMNAALLSLSLFYRVCLEESHGQTGTDLAKQWHVLPSAWKISLLYSCLLVYLLIRVTINPGICLSYSDLLLKVPSLGHSERSRLACGHTLEHAPPCVTALVCLHFYSRLHTSLGPSVHPCDLQNQPRP